MNVDRLHQKINDERIVLDPSQKEILEQLNTLAAVFQKKYPLLKWLRCLHLPFKPIKGIYLWGDVGRGKTLLMDQFYEELEIKAKRRIHFHRFMIHVHHELTKYPGKADPLKWVAKDIAKSTHIICFDEFFVSDIADAMLLGTLFQHLFRQGVTLVATSNIPPSNLYHNGLQRSKFLPTIALLEKHTTVLHLEDGEDYRLRTLSQAEIYHYPLDDIADQNMSGYFEALCHEGFESKKVLTIAGREIETVRCGDGVIWFLFSTICGSARSSLDYIEISKMYNTVLLSEVPIMSEAKEDAARRFITLVDELYDRQVKLIVSAQAPLTELYQGRLLKTEFERTESRMTEMQSIDYLQKPHLP